jgi:hypothetical protein
VRSSQEPEFINIYFITEAATRILFQTAAWAKGVQVRLVNRYRTRYPLLHHGGGHQNPLQIAAWAKGVQVRLLNRYSLLVIRYNFTEAATRILFQTAAWAKGVQVRLVNR